MSNTIRYEVSQYVKMQSPTRKFPFTDYQKALDFYKLFGEENKYGNGFVRIEEYLYTDDEDRQFISAKVIIEKQIYVND